MRLVPVAVFAAIVFVIAWVVAALATDDWCGNEETVECNATGWLTLAVWTASGLLLVVVAAIAVSRLARRNLAQRRSSHHRE